MTLDEIRHQVGRNIDVRGLSTNPATRAMQLEELYNVIEDLEEALYAAGIQCISRRVMHTTYIASIRSNGIVVHIEELV